MKRTTLCNNRFAMILSIIALFFLSLVPLALMDDDANSKDAVFGFMMFASLFGVPGLWLCLRGRKKHKHDVLIKQLSGYFKSHDRFTAAEMAKKIGKTEMETESLIFAMIDEQNIDLVFHRKTRQYLHKNRIHKNYHQLDRCHSCGANLEKEVVLEGEMVSCQYCGHQI